MESCPWGVLLLCGVAVAATALAPPQEPLLSHEEALSLAVGLYNQESETGFAFRLLEAKPQPEWDPLRQGVQELEFIVKETTCPASKLPRLGECDFKDGGLVKKCTGRLAVVARGMIQLDCETAAEEHIRVRRGGFHKLKAKLKKVMKEVLKEAKKMIIAIKCTSPPCTGHVPQGPGGGLAG